MRSLLVAATAALVLASAASAGTLSPCALVTAADAGKALGVTVGRGCELGFRIGCVSGLRTTQQNDRSSWFDKVRPQSFVYIIQDSYYCQNWRGVNTFA